MKISDYRKKTIEKLSCAGIERPAYVVDMLLSKIAGIGRTFAAAHPDFELAQTQLRGLETAVAQRLARMPLSYILGEAEFYGYVFKVGQGCLVPRPETELLVEAMLETAPRSGCFADWCTGSGCIAISMLLERRDLTAVAVDASAEALAWAEKNRALHGLEHRLALIQNADPHELSFERQFDFIVANPPYIPHAEMRTLMKDVAEYEPALALDGGQDGVELYKLFFDTLPAFVKSGGHIGFEIAGDRQAEILKGMAPHTLRLSREIRDYSGILRHLIYEVL